MILIEQATRITSSAKRPKMHMNSASASRLLMKASE